MPSIFFRGRALPLGLKYSANMSGKGEVSHVDGREFLISMNIEASRIVVELEGDIISSSDLVACYQMAHSYARVVIDLAGLASGIGMTVILEQVRLPGKSYGDLSLQMPDLGKLITAYNNSNTNDVAHLVLMSVPLQHAIHDLAQALSAPETVIINCARAVEAIRHLLAIPGMSINSAWENLREKLHVDRAYIQLLTDTSTDYRHGNWFKSQIIPNGDILERAWNIMNRYLSYRLGGDAQLSFTDFPLLQG